MLALLSTIGFALAPVAGAPTLPQDPSAATVPGETSGAALEDELFGPPLIVNGETVGSAAFRRYFVVGLGANQLEKAKFDVFLQGELARRIAAGEPREKYEVDQAAVDAELDFMRKDFSKRYPTLDFDLETKKAFMSLGLYRQQLVQQQLFDALFLPDNPADWPELSREALISEGGGQEFWQDAERDYEQRKQRMQDDKLDELPDVSPVWKDVWRSMVLELINSYITVDSNPDLLPAGTAFIVEGKSILIDDVFRDIRQALTPEHIQEARHWLALTTAIRQRLEKEGVLLSWTDYLKDWLKDGKSFHQQLYVHQMLAIQALGYPSTYLYIDQQRLEQSYKNLLKTQVDWDQALRASLARTDWITGVAQAHVEMILISAYDFRKHALKPGGWADAQKQAAALAQRLENGADWGDMLDRYSEFYDAPVGDSEKVIEGTQYNKGRFGSRTRNDLLPYADESEYYILMHGHSVADHAFFDQPIGKIEGPFKGRYGYYFSKVFSRTPVVKPLNLEHPKLRETAEIYYLRRAFCDFARQVEKESEFVGWSPENRES